MLTQLKLDNFKIWQSTGPIRLAPVTLLLGINSSGKSSLIQSLLLLRQTTEPHEDWQPDLDFGNAHRGSKVQMGAFRDVLCQHGNASAAIKASQIGIEFSWTPTGVPADIVTFSARYSGQPTDLPASGSARIDYLRIGKDGEGFSVERGPNDVYKLNLGNQRNALGRSFDYKPHQSFSFPPKVIQKLDENGLLIEEAGNLLLRELSRIIYLGPLREMAQREYPSPGKKIPTIGDDGTNAPALLIASALSFAAAKNKPGALPETARLFDQTSHWLQNMGLADGIAIKRKVRSLEKPHVRYELRIESDGESSNLKDVGVGVSQVLPVIVAALTAESGHIVIVEEPESHLHPLAQAGLAELFAAVSRERNVQFIVETHSEHLFRRMQTLIARGALTPNDTTMYFIHRQGKKAKIEELDADNDGRIKNWPDKFFGDSMGETREQTALAIKRAKELRGRDGDVSG